MRIIRRFILRFLGGALVLLVVLGAIVAHVPDPQTGLNPMGERVFVPEGQADIGAPREMVEGSNTEVWANSFDPEAYPDYYYVVSEYPAELRTNLDNGIFYGSTDELGRTGGAGGWITSDMLSNAPDVDAGTLNMGAIPYVEVPGTPGRRGFTGNLWGAVNLIPPSLGGDNSAHNLVPGTNMLAEGDGDTLGGLALTEALVRSYLAEHPDGRVWYLVTPVYEPGETIPRAVLAGVATEDGELSVRVCVFNAANGLDIDYVTGEARPS